MTTVAGARSPRALSMRAPDPRLAVVAALAIALLATLLAPETAHAQDATASKPAYDVAGKIGIGYTTGNAPLGIRWWIDNQFGFDANLGLVLNGEEPDVEGSDPDDTTVTADFALDAGFLIALWKGDNTIFYVRPGLNFDRRYAVGQADDGSAVHSSVDTLSVTAMGGIELFLGGIGLENFSLQGAVGVGFNYVSPAAQVGDDDGDWSLGSLVTDVSVVETVQLGFHYYFM